MDSFIKQAAAVKPSMRQYFWYETEFYGFVHFSPNTYTNLEWGLGNEDPAIFNPTELDCDSWVAALKSAGMRGMVLTAKHHDGFCLWQTAHSEHSMKNSPYKDGKGDIVREASEACRRGRFAFGIYLSPWDRNCPLYGTPEYNDYYKAQLTELMTNYGNISMVWFDGACGEGPNGKKQEYDFAGYIDIVRKLQPRATIFGSCGDIRWCGNEEGKTRECEWAVVPSELCELVEPQTGAGPDYDGSLTVKATDEDVGSRALISRSKGLVFAGAEVDMSIRPGWFYHPNEEPHSLDRLFDTYVRAVGGNCSLNLNVPPMPNGKFDPRDIARLAELGKKIKDSFTNEVPFRIDNGKSEDGMAYFTLTFPVKSKVNYVVLQENLMIGQRVESFVIRDPSAKDGDCIIFKGTTIGHKKICKVDFEGLKLEIAVTAERDASAIRSISLY